MTVELMENAPTQVTRRMSWEGLTTVNMVGNTESETGLTSQQMLEAANLDWDVDVRPLWRRLNNGEFTQHPKWREVYRTDNENTLGVCRSRYNTFSNAEAFAFGDDLVSEGAGRWVTAGDQVGGARVFMVMELGEGFDVLGGDSYKTYLYIRTSHGDGTSISARIIPFRLWCLNQNSAAIKSAISEWAVPHTTTVKDRLEEARNALKLTMNYEAEFQKLAEQLAGVKVNDETAKRLIESVFPANRARRDDIIGDVISNYQTSPTVEPFRGTGYGLYNGLTEYMDHVKVQRNDNARFQSIMYGEGQKVQDQLVRALMAIN